MTLFAATEPQVFRAAFPITDTSRPPHEVAAEFFAKLPALAAERGLALSGRPEFTTNRPDIDDVDYWHGYVLVVAAPAFAVRRAPAADRLSAAAVEAALRGERPELSAAERIAAIRIGLYQGMSERQLAALFDGLSEADITALALTEGEPREPANQ